MIPQEQGSNLTSLEEGQEVSTVPEEILIDSETWGIGELLEVIASRYFDLGSEGGHPNSWEVRGLRGSDVGRQLKQLNIHLEPMGLVGSLESSNPPLMTISRSPSGSSVMEGYQQVTLWVVMAAFMTLVGKHWVSEYGYGEGSTESEFVAALVFFTAPVVLSFLLASFCRSLVARRFGIEIGHITPIVFPIPTWWAFGIVGALGQRKVDLVPMPNRRALGSIEVVVPTILFFTGSILTILGILLTPNSPPELSGAPTIFDSSLVVGSLVESWMGSEMEIRLQWLHPTGIAGIGLSIVGWVLMLPIPGLPGDRLLHALIGPAEMRGGTTQTSVFLLVLFVMVLVFATAQWTPWVFLAFVAAWQRFNPDSLPQPIVLDEHAGLEERFRSRFLAIAGIVLLAGLPSSVPSYEMEEYDSGISTENWQEEAFFSPGIEEEITLILEPGGVMPVSGWLQIRVEGSDPDDWLLNYSCQISEGFDHSCRFDNVTQEEIFELTLLITPPDEDFSTHILRIFIEITGYEVEHVIKLYSEGGEGFVDPFWERSGSSENPTICADLNTMGGLLKIDDSYWKHLNNSNLSSGTKELCLIGHEGAIQSSNLYDNRGRAFGPIVSIVRENETIGAWAIPILNSEPSIQVEDGNWEVPAQIISSGDIIYHSDHGSPFCPSIRVAPQIETGENWTVEMGNYTAIRIMGNLSGKGNIGIGDKGWIAICQDDGVLASFVIRDSVDVFVHPGGLDRGISEDEFEIFNRRSEMVDLSVEWHGDSPQSGIWNVSMSDWIESGSNTSISVGSIGPSSLERSVWVTADDSGITVHLSARCPTEGC